MQPGGSGAGPSGCCLAGWSWWELRAVVGTRIALPGFEPGEHLQHPVPTPTPAWVLGRGVWLPTHDPNICTAPEEPAEICSLCPREGSGPSHWHSKCLLSAEHPHSPSTPLRGRWEPAVFQPVSVWDRKWLVWPAAGGPIMSHRPPCPLCVLSAANLASRTFRPRYIRCF